MRRYQPGTGFLSDEEGYHTAPTPTVEHDGRIWKAFEFAPEPDRDGWRIFVISAPVGADLINRESWTFSEQIDTWPGYQWIEGNVVVTPTGELVDMLRTNNRNKKREGFDGDDIVYASRTAYDDGLGGAHRAHDANFLTFGRIEGFRESSS